MKISFYILIFFFLVACQTEEKEAVNVSEIVKKTENITLTEAQAKMSNIQTAMLSKQNISANVSANGMIATQPQNTVAVHPLAKGFLKEIRVLVGQNVQKGEIIGVLQHPDYIQLQETYLSTQNQLVFMSQEYERQKTLDEKNAIAKRDFQKTIADFESLKNQKSGLTAQLELLGIDVASISNKNIQKSIFIKAPISGSISKVNLTIGKFVNLEEQLFEIVNKDHLHAELQVFDKDILRVKIGQKVHFNINGNSETEFMAYVKLIGETVDQQSKTVSIHAHVEGKLDLLKIGMFVNARIHASADSTWTLPESALLIESDAHFVFVEKKPFEYLKVPVKIGSSEHGFTQILNWQDLENSKVVISGINSLNAVLNGVGEEE